MRQLWVIVLLFFLMNPLIGKEKLHRLGIFPQKTELAAARALEIFDSLGLKEQFPNKIDETSPHHYLLFEVPFFEKAVSKILEVPDFQINYLKIYVVEGDSKLPRPILYYGDELPIKNWTHSNRTCHTLFEFKPQTSYRLLVYYSRPGNSPQIQINTHDPSDYVFYHNKLERKFGVIYGLIATYTILIGFLWLFSGDKRYYYLALWIFVYFVYYFITSGHFKFYFKVDLEGKFSTIRVTFAFFGIYAMNAFSIIHYNREKQLKFITWFWDAFLLLSIVLNVYNYWTGENVFVGIEKEFILMLRILVVILIIIQLYLPISHYRKYKKLTYLTYIWIFSGGSFVVYLYQTINLQELDFNEYIFFAVWFLIFEIIVIALGLSIYTLKQKQKRIEIDRKNSLLQQNARLIQFEVQEKERKQIASELHDNILNRLSMASSLFRDDFIDTEKFKTNLKSIANDIKAYSIGIYPNWTEKSTIQEYIEKQIHALSELNGFEYEFSSDLNNSEMDSTAQLHLFRLVQEFIKNAVTHGKATHIKVSIYENSDGIRVSLRDNGIGFDNKLILPGLGLESAKNRVQILGGTLLISSMPGNGVSWEFNLPC